MTLPLPASQIHLHEPAASQAKRAYIIYFITGNPGLIEYYRTFLTHLYGLLTQSSPSSTSLHVFGRSLSGFEASTSTGERRDGNPPFSLQEQISRSQSALEELVRNVREKNGVQDVRVILMGHSVGSYILLEVIRRVREKAKVEKDAVRIAGGVCLFPTVTHIAKSESGRKATVRTTQFLLYAHIHSNQPSTRIQRLRTSISTLSLRPNFPLTNLTNILSPSSHSHTSLSWHPN
jgi:predicted esterase